MIRESEATTGSKWLSKWGGWSLLMGKRQGTSWTSHQVLFYLGQSFYQNKQYFITTWMCGVKKQQIGLYDITEKHSTCLSLLLNINFLFTKSSTFPFIIYSLYYLPFLLWGATSSTVDMAHSGQQLEAVWRRVPLCGHTDRSYTQ